MWMKGKKIITMALAVSMAVGTLAGCGSKTESAATQSADAAAGENGREVITIGIRQHSNVENYDTNYFTKLVEDELNVDLQFSCLPSSMTDSKSKFAVLVSSNEKLPDMIIDIGLSPLDVIDYGTKGIFISLNSYLDKAENFNKIPEDDRNAIRQYLTAPDGNIYSLGKYVAELTNQIPYKMWINQVWLDNLGLETPTTTEEYKEVLKAFVEQDANGNGVQDEVGVTGCTLGWGCNSSVFLMNSFIFYNGGDVNGGLSLADDGKTVMAPWVTEEWKAGLSYMNELVQDGLMSPSVFTQDDKQYTALLSNEEQIVGSCSAGAYGYWSGSQANPNCQDMVLLPPLKGPEGTAWAAYKDVNVLPTVMITKDCENPELAFSLADLFFRRDIALSSRYGEEGVDWSGDPEVCKDYQGLFEASEGVPCTIAQIQNQWSKAQNKHWYDVICTYRDEEMFKGRDSGKKTELEGKRDFAAELANKAVDYYYDEHPAQILPNLIYTVEESDELATLQENVSAYVKESLAAFVTGNRPLSDWDSYLKEMENMGLNRWLEIAQTAYDRMQNTQLEP